jgi:hypothetical protein
MEQKMLYTDVDSKSSGQKTTQFFAFESGLTTANRAC